MAFITVTDADILDSSFWNNIDFNANSTIDVSNVSADISITMTGTQITFTNSTSGLVTTYANSDLSSGSFANNVQYIGNDGENNVSGAINLDSNGYAGGAGNDTLTDDGSNGGGIDGNDGDDILTGGVGNNNINGDAGNDTLFGTAGNNNLSGGIGNDTLFGEDGSGNLDGGDGDDVIYASTATSFVQGGAGFDTLIIPEGATVSSFSATGGNVTFAGGGGFTYLNIEDFSIACFALGTLIQTSSGDVCVQNLEIGDLIDTLDNGEQTVKWIGQRTISGREKFAPIVFEAGTIGNTKRLLVSPQHRVLLDDWRAEMLFGEEAILTAAKNLINGDTIYSAPTDEVTYFHILFEAHEIIFSNGAKTESFYPGDTIMDSMEDAVRDEIYDLFPELRDPNFRESFTFARPIITAYETRALIK